MARKFFYVCAGMLMLALSYHFGASTATAQAPSNPVVGLSAYTTNFLVMTANGDSYVTPNYGQSWYRYANCFTGTGPTPTAHESWGQLKSRYATPPATPGMTVTPGADNR